jgi:hypothetical protein
MSPISPVNKEKWDKLQAAFEVCLQLEGQGIPMSAEVQTLKRLSEEFTTHIGDQWQKHNSIRNYLQSWGN